MKLHPTTTAQTQQSIPAGQAAAVDLYYAHQLEVGRKAEMGGCMVEIKRIAGRLWLSVWPQTGDGRNPTTHTHLGRGMWLRERCPQSHTRPFA